MKKVITIGLFTLMTVFTIQAQVPEQISYQAIIRDAQGELLQNQRIDLKLSIVKGSTQVSSIYTETYSAMTNENGLVTLSIGTGTSSSNFADIDWGQGPLFIKIEANTQNSNKYNIVGTTPLLSVPYALYAKTAETALNTQNDSGSSPGAEHYIGEFHEGGIIIWLDHTGKHGLIVGLKDISKQAFWSNIANKAIGKQAGSKTDGNKNSEAITQQEGHTDSAAKLCLNYTNSNDGGTSKSDWYLPSIEELRILAVNRYEIQRSIDEKNANDINAPIDNIADKFYWSSTEQNEYSAWGINFYNANPYTSNKYSEGYVRPFRKF